MVGAPWSNQWTSPGTWRNQCLPKGIPEDPWDHPMECHPGSKRFIKFSWLEAYLCSHKLIWALAELSTLCDLFPGRLADVLIYVGVPVYPWLRGNASERLCLNLPVLKHQAVRGLQRRWSSLVGKSAQTSAECKTNRLAVSPVMDNSSI
jgi:hypothetical protein